MILFSENKFLENPFIDTAIDDSLFTEENIKHFDNDGFQLNFLEQQYYRARGIKIVECLGVFAAHYDWCTISSGSNFILDHAMVITRCSYIGQALEQIKHHSKQYPYLKKYLLARPKWGLDFALEYVDDNGYLEVLHFEKDFLNLEQALSSKKQLEKQLLSTNWDKFVDDLKSTKYEWQSLEGLRKNDWKARKWGFECAETTLKSFDGNL
jgi:hypothetical protein